MKVLNSYGEFENLTVSEETFLLFVKTDNCSVCEGLRPQIEELQKETSIPFYLVNAARVPQVAGQLMLFSAPVVLIFQSGRETDRWARFVPVSEVERRLARLEEERNV